MGSTPPPSRPLVLRGATLFAAPFDLIGLAGAIAAVALLLALVSGRGDDGAVGWILLAGSVALAAAGFALARGCRVVIAGEEVRDQLAWSTRWSCERRRIRTVRVRRGPWRTFEAVLDDQTVHVMRGIGPLQFPANLVPGAAERDLRVIDDLMGPDRHDDGPSARVSS